MNNFLRYIYQALTSKSGERKSAPVASVPEPTTTTETITLTETTFTHTVPVESTDPDATSLFACGTGVRFSATYTVTASSSYSWVKGPWVCPGCWVHVQTSGSIVGSLGNGVTGNLYPEGYYGNTITGAIDSEVTRTIAQPWLTQAQYPPGIFVTNKAKPYSLHICLSSYYSNSGNTGSEYIPRNLFVGWPELYSLSQDKPSSEGGFLWFALNHNSSGLSGIITVKFDIYFECNTIDIPVTTNTGSTTSTTTTSSTDTPETTSDTNTGGLHTDTTTVAGDGWGPA